MCVWGGGGGVRKSKKGRAEGRALLIEQVFKLY